MLKELYGGAGGLVLNRRPGWPFVIFGSSNEECLKCNRSKLFSVFFLRYYQYCAPADSYGMSGKIFSKVDMYPGRSAHEHHMNTKIWIYMKFQPILIREQPRAGNQAEKKNLRVIDAQNHLKYEKHEIYEKIEKMYMNVKNNEKMMKFQFSWKWKLNIPKWPGDIRDHFSYRPSHQNRAIQFIKSWIFEFINFMIVFCESWLKINV